MCGISGIEDFSEHDIFAKAIKEMVHSTPHLGPDYTGVNVSGLVGLATEESKDAESRQTKSI